MKVLKQFVKIVYVEICILQQILQVVKNYITEIATELYINRANSLKQIFLLMFHLFLKTK